jgi:hypothetical protein
MTNAWHRSREKFAALRKAEAAGIVADSTDVRKALMARFYSGELTLEQVQSELKRIKRGAKAQGKITRDQAFR